MNEPEVKLNETKPEKRGPGRPKKEVPVSLGVSGDDVEFWKSAFLVAMENFQVRHANELGRCVDLANAALEEMKKAVK